MYKYTEKEIENAFRDILDNLVDKGAELVLDDLPVWYENAHASSLTFGMYLLKGNKKFMLMKICSASELETVEPNFKEFIYTCHENIREQDVNLESTLVVYANKDKLIESEEYVNRHLDMYRGWQKRDENGDSIGWHLEIILFKSMK